MESGAITVKVGPDNTITAKGARKTGKGRVIPISARLHAVLTMAQTDPTGKTFGPDRYVFGDTVGARVKDTKRAWERAVLKAHGHEPRYTRQNALCVASRVALREADLEFRDLRHEAGSRLIEAGWPLHNVSHMLGHANISQTSTYLNATKVGLQESMRRLDASRPPVAISLQADGRNERAPLCNDDRADAPQPSIN